MNAANPQPESRRSPERILQRLDWQVIRRLDGLLQGDYRSLFYGYGIDFSDLREYQPEGDIRYIDWNVTARMDSPYVRQYVEDREITAWFLLDLSPSVDFGAAANPNGETAQKRAVLVDFSATLARILTRHGNRVGAIFYDSRIERTIPAGGGKLQVLRLINDLMKQPPLTRAPLTDLAPLLTGALNAIRRRSLVFVVSDFISAPGWEKSLRMLSARHEVIAVRLFDPTELDFPDVGAVILEDAETGEQIFVDTHDPLFRKRYQAAAQEREAALSESFKIAGVDVLALSTGGDMVKSIAQFAARQKQRRQTTRSSPVTA